MSDGASFVSYTDVPWTMTVGEKRKVMVRMRNTGTSTWTASGGYELASERPQDNTTWGMSRVALSRSVAPGSAYTFTFTITTPSTVGDYVLQWRMAHNGLRFGAGTFNKTISVNGVGTTMSLTLDKKTIDVGGVTRVTATGTGLGSARFFVGTGDAARTCPTVELVSVNTAGDTATLDIDATATETDGYYALYATTPDHAAGHAGFRVVPDEVAVVAYSPSAVVEGNRYVVSVIGANLDRATLGVSNPRVKLTGVTRAPGGLALGGVMAVPTDVSEFDLELEVLGASKVSLSVSTAAQGASAAATTVGNAPTFAAVGAPELLYQAPVRPATARASSTEASPGPLRRAGQPVSAGFQFRYDHHDTWNLVSIVEGAAVSTGVETGELANDVLQRLIAGSSVELETLVFQLRLRISLTIAASACVNFGPGGVAYDVGLDVCVTSDVILSIPFVGTTRFYADVCLSVGSSLSGRFDLGVHGALANFRWNKSFGAGSAPGNLDTCVTVTDLEADPRKGLRRTLVQTAECCSSAPSLALATSGSAYFGNFAVDETV